MSPGGCVFSREDPHPAHTVRRCPETTCTSSALRQGAAVEWGPAARHALESARLAQHKDCTVPGSFIGQEFMLVYVQQTWLRLLQHDDCDYDRLVKQLAASSCSQIPCSAVTVSMPYPAPWISDLMQYSERLMLPAQDANLAAASAAQVLQLVGLSALLHDLHHPGLQGRGVIGLPALRTRPLMLLQPSQYIQSMIPAADRGNASARELLEQTTSALHSRDRTKHNAHSSTRGDWHHLVRPCMPSMQDAWKSLECCSARHTVAEPCARHRQQTELCTQALATQADTCRAGVPVSGDLDRGPDRGRRGRRCRSRLAAPTICRAPAAVWHPSAQQIAVSASACPSMDIGRAVFCQHQHTTNIP